MNGHKALNLWRRVLSDMILDRGIELTTRQMVVLLTVYLDAGPHTVRGLAASLGISKPSVTRALDRLGTLDLLRRKPDDSDRRSVVVQRTVKGAVFLTEFADSITATAQKNDGSEDMSVKPPKSGG